MSDQIRSYLDFEKPVAELDSKVDELRALAASGTDIAEEVSRIEEKAAQALADLYANLTPWQKTLVARHPQRPHFTDFVGGLITEFTPLAGDRKYGDDEALMGGFGRFKGESICVMGQEKGNTTDSRIKHNFGMARPEGYRKAVRLMEMAERFGIPVLSIVDFGGRLSRHRRGGARPGRGDRTLHRCLPVARRAQCCRRHRRGHVGRRHRDYHRQPRLDAGACDLQRNLAGSRVLDPVAGRHQGPGSRQQHEDHGAGHAAISAWSIPS